MGNQAVGYMDSGNGVPGVGCMEYPFSEIANGPQCSVGRNSTAVDISARATPAT